MKMHQRKHYNRQMVFLSTVVLPGYVVTGPNWYFRKKCINSLRRRWARLA